MVERRRLLLATVSAETAPAVQDLFSESLSGGALSNKEGLIDPITHGAAQLALPA
jgi:hypothetical protein